MSSPQDLVQDATRHRQAQQEDQRRRSGGDNLYPVADPDDDQEQPPKEDPNSLRSLLASESLEKDRGDVKAATGNKNFDEQGTPKQQQTPAVPAPQQQQEPGGGDHLERSREPCKPGSSHPVMDSSK